MPEGKQFKFESERRDLRLRDRIQENWISTDDCGVSPCFAPCGEAACRKLGCIRVYNARNRDAS